MSYDFVLFRPEPGLDVNEAAEKWLASEEARLLTDEPAAIDPAREDIKNQLSEALIGRNPKLVSFGFDYAAIAGSKKITEEEARLRHRNIELNGPEDGNGIQIELYDDSAGITVPYWHSRNQADNVFREIWEYLQILEEKGGFRTFDPQLGHVLDLTRDFDAVTSVYSHTVVLTASLIGKPKKPWWQLW